MKDHLRKALHLQEGEKIRPVLALGFLLLSNSMAQQIAKIVSVSGFLKKGGANQILILWLIDMTLILLLAGLQSLIVDRFKRATLMRWMIIGLAVVYLTLRLMFLLQVREQIIYAITFILVDLQWMFFPIIFWILANDVFNMAQAKRIFPLIASWSFAGKILGIGFSAASPSLLNWLGMNVEEVLVLNALIYLLAYLATAIGLRRVKVRETISKQATMRETLVEGWDFVQNIPAFRYLALAIAAVSVTLTINEFNFLVVSDTAFSSRDSYQQFYSFYQMGLTLASLATQGLLTSRIIQRIRLKNAFIIQPAATLACTVWMTVQASIIGAVGGMILAKLSQKTIDESARKAFQSIVPEERRGRVSIFTDSYLPAGATILGSLLTLAILSIGSQLGSSVPFYAYMAVAALAGLLAVWAAFRMSRVYDTSMLNWRLKRRQRAASVLDKLDF
jgi:AAA family ATP:ADP antiporter